MYFLSKRLFIFCCIIYYTFQGVVGTVDSCKSTLISAFHEGVVEMGEDDPRKSNDLFHCV